MAGRIAGLHLIPAVEHVEHGQNRPARELGEYLGIGAHLSAQIHAGAVNDGELAVLLDGIVLQRRLGRDLLLGHGIVHADGRAVERQLVAADIALLFAEDDACLLYTSSVVVVCFGLEKVTNVLGFVGTLIIVILIGVGIYCFCTADSGVMQAQQNVQQYVDAGVIMRANFLGIENPILAVTSLIGAYITLGLSFNVSLGGRCGSRREVSASAVISARCV